MRAEYGVASDIGRAVGDLDFVKTIRGQSIRARKATSREGEYLFWQA